MKTTQDRRGPVRTAEPILDGGPRIEAIREAAVRLFRQHGYHATTMRELAREVGMEAPSLYNHFPSKHDLLADILIRAMRRLVDDVSTAVEAAPDDSPSKLRAAIRAYVMFHEENLAAAFISDTERRALHGRAASKLLSLRRELGETFKDIIAAGAQSGDFQVHDTSLAAIGVLSLCARLPVWFRLDGRLSLAEVATVMEAQALGALGAPVSRGRRRSR